MCRQSTDGVRAVGHLGNSLGDKAGPFCECPSSRRQEAQTEQGSQGQVRRSVKISSHGWMVSNTGAFCMEVMRGNRAVRRVRQCNRLHRKLWKLLHWELSRSSWRSTAQDDWVRAGSGGKARLCFYRSLGLDDPSGPSHRCDTRRWP